MNIWSQIFAEKFRIVFKVYVYTDRGESVKGGQVWTEREGRSKITEKVRTSFMDDTLQYLNVL